MEEDSREDISSMASGIGWPILHQTRYAKGAGGYLPTGIAWYRKHLTSSSIEKGQQFSAERGAISAFAVLENLKEAVLQIVIDRADYISDTVTINNHAYLTFNYIFYIA